MIKVFTVNGNGKIEFTKAELEKLLNEVYAEGQKNCNCGKGITWTNPYVAPFINCNDSITTNASTNGAPATATITLNNADAREMSKRIDRIIEDTAESSSVFSKLARELSF